MLLGFLHIYKAPNLFFGYWYVYIYKAPKFCFDYWMCVYLQSSSHCCAVSTGNLVTVKYLRLERYHERFPDSIGLLAYMQPSNSQRKSLSVPFHRSVLENS